MYLVLPDKYQKITVKIIGKIEETKTRKGDEKRDEKRDEKKDEKENEKEDNPDFYIPCRIWAISGYRFDNVFKLKFNKSIFDSLYRGLEILEAIGDDSCKIDDNMECLIGKIITIRGIPDYDRSYKDKYGKVDNPKIFDVEIRYDLEEIEKAGGQGYIDAQKKERGDNVWCIHANMSLVNKDIKKETRSKTKKQTREKVNKDVTKDVTLWS